MRWFIPTILGAITILVITYNPNPTPYCDISIKPDSTWTWNTTPTTDCDFPEWGIFHPDGTWDTP